jgi:hypothetical protein
VGRGEEEGKGLVERSHYAYISFPVGFSSASVAFDSYSALAPGWLFTNKGK